MKLTKLQFYFHSPHIFIMQHTSIKNKKIYGTELRLPTGCLTKEQIKQGSRISDPADEQTVFCLLDINTIQIWRESAVTHMHFSSTLDSIQDIHQSVTTPHTLDIFHSHHPLPIQGFIMHSYQSFQNLILHWNRSQPPQRPKYCLVINLRRALVHIQSHSLKIHPKINRRWKMNIQAHQIRIFNFKY